MANRITSYEHRSRRLFNYLMQAAINEDKMNRPGASSSGTLRALMDELLDSLKKAERAGSKAPLGQGFEPVAIAVLSARLAAHAYALARNEGVLSDLELPDIAGAIDA